MCKLRVDTILQGPKEVEVPGQDFKAYRFQCEGMVNDNNSKFIERSFVFETTSTTIRDGIKPGVELEATRFLKAEGQVYSVKAGSNPHIKSPKGKFKHKGHTGAETNRQRALSLAVELERGRSLENGAVPSNEEITKTAEYFLNWLERV